MLRTYRPSFDYTLPASLMSDTPAIETAEEPLFSVAEVEQFSEDDTTAGRAIGKMLSALFLYTVLAMCLVTWWTLSSLADNHGEGGAEPAAATAPAH